MAEFQGNGIEAIVVEAQVVFSLGELCRASGCEEAQVIALVAEGVLEPVGHGTQEWVFEAPSLRTARMAQRLARDLELNLAGTAIVFELLAQIESLHSRLRRAGVG